MKTALISGISGQDGSYLAELLLEKGYAVHGIVRRTSAYHWDRIKHLEDKVTLHYGDLGDSGSLGRILDMVQPHEVYNLAAQSHVKVSFEIPEYTADVTGAGTIRMLEELRRCPGVRYYQASSSEMFGSSPPPQNELTPFHPRSPYGCAKVFSYHATVNYREAYGLHASNGILFNHECLSSDTPVIIKRDNRIFILRAEDVGERPTKERRQWVPEKVELWDNTRWSAVKLITATWNSAAQDKDVRAVNCRGGYYEATADHISFRDGPVECKTASLSPGDRLALGQFPELPETEVCSDNLAEFLGMLAADGYVAGNHARFTKNDDALRARAEELWALLAVGESRESTYPGGYPNSGLVKRVDLSGNVEFCYWLRAQLYDSRGFKIVPFQVLNGPRSAKLAFLRGYNCCDGLKGGRQKTEFKSFTTDSPALALGLWVLVETVLGLRVTSHPERRQKLYYHLNINAPRRGNRGKHLVKPLSEVKEVESLDYVGWLYDFETDSGTFSAGVGRTWVHNSPRRGENFVTRKITRGIGRIVAGLQDKIVLGNLDARRDWGHAKDYVEAMWLMLQQDAPDDYVIATGETHSVTSFLEAAFSCSGLPEGWWQYVETNPKFIRPAEVDILLGDPTKAKTKLGWSPRYSFKQLVEEMVFHDIAAAKNKGS